MFGENEIELWQFLGLKYRTLFIILRINILKKTPKKKKLVQFQCYAIYRNDTAKALKDPTMGIEDLKYHLLMGWELSKCF